VSRTDKLLLRRLFELEVPEIYNGSVEIVAIAREPGWRSKVAVFAKQDGVDAVGSCVGLRGIRIQSIVNELHGEKIDVVQWNKDPAAFISSSLSPSQVMRVDLDEETGSAVAIVPERQLSLAIGKEGQNARLAARLTGWRVDIKSNVEDEAERDAKRGAAPVSVAAGDIESVEHMGLSTRVLNTLKQAGVDKVAQLLNMSESDLLQIDKFGQKSLDELQARLGELGLKAEEAAPEAVAAAAEEPAEVEVVEAPPPAEVVEPEPVLAQAEAVVEAQQPEPVAVDGQEEAPAAVEAVEPEPVPVDVIPEELLAAEEEKEPVPVGESLALIQDLPKNIWSVSTTAPAESGGLRFAEDIEELRRGTGPRRGRRSGGGGGGRGRNTRARKRR
jgi:transcription antitermination factor NusA-like protein